MWRGKLRTLVGLTSLLFKEIRVREGEIKDRQHHLDYKGSGTVVAYACEVKNKAQLGSIGGLLAPRGIRRDSRQLPRKLQLLHVEGWTSCHCRVDGAEGFFRQQLRLQPLNKIYQAGDR